MTIALSSLYLEGYKDGSNSHSWQARLFLEKSLPLNVNLSYKEIKEAGFIDWLGKQAPKLDYYVLRDYGVTI